MIGDPKSELAMQDKNASEVVASLKIDPASSGRRYDLDWLRVLVFGLLIFYHIGMMYVPWQWLIKSSHHIVGLDSVMTFVNQWRLPLLFLISGIASSIVCGKIGNRAFFGGCIKRLFLPLMFGVVFIVPPQSYFELLWKAELETGYLQFWQRYLSFDQGFSIILPTWNHLWYLFYLFVFSLVLLLLLIPLGKMQRWVRSNGLGQNYGTLKLLILPAMTFALYGWTLKPYFPPTLDFFHDWYNNVFYFTIFLIGFVISDEKKVWNIISASRHAALLLGCSLTAILLPLYQYSVANVEVPDLRGIYVAAAFNLWSWMIAILGYGHRFLNRKSTVLTYLTEAVYPYYIIHQTITVVVGFNVINWHLPAWQEFLVLTIATFGGCAVLYEFLIRRTAFLRPLFGLKSA